MPTPYNVALLGNPVRPRDPAGQSWFTVPAVQRLKTLGFTVAQLNIAWGDRPGDEALNLEDILPPADGDEADRTRLKRSEINRRASICREQGVRALFHFGAPRVEGTLYDLIVGPNFVTGQQVRSCISDPAVRESYVQKLEALARLCPDVEDLMVYTFDQEAWICSEFGTCPHCRGVPLHERLPAFLIALSQAWTSLRPAGRFFWEPWELSAGEVYRMVQALAGKVPDGFGLMLHGNIAECMMTHTADTWFRNTARLAAEAGIAVIAETFLSQANEEISPLQHLPAPRLTFEAVQRLQAVPNVSGIKEYFGTIPLEPDPNLETAGFLLRNPAASINDAIAHVAARFGPAQQTITTGWEAAAKAMAFFPWDVCWRFRNAGKIKPVHGWDAFWFNGFLVHSPSWCSTRRTVYMATEREPVFHSWFLEDIGLRWELALEQLERATQAYTAALPQLSVELQSEVQHWIHDTQAMLRVSRNFVLHIRETLLARTMRLALDNGASLQTLWLDRMQSLLNSDLAAQADHLTAAQRRVAEQVVADFANDPHTWLKQYMLDKQTDVLRPQA